MTTPLDWIDPTTIRLFRYKGHHSGIYTLMQRAVRERAEQLAWLRQNGYAYDLKAARLKRAKGGSEHEATLSFRNPDHAIAFKLRWQ
jgi:hypothetical protein